MRVRGGWEANRTCAGAWKLLILKEDGRNAGLSLGHGGYGLSSLLFYDHMNHCYDFLLHRARPESTHDWRVGLEAQTRRPRSSRAPVFALG